jgi:sirohydrochlorin ferrochelatase
MMHRPPPAVIVAHGDPNDPPAQEAVLQALAGSVARLLPGRCVLGATLAAPGALERALDGMEQPLVYPFFMASGWFTGTALPRRLAAAGAGTAVQLAPFGLEAELPALIAGTVGPALAAPGVRQALLLAAHGSQVSRTSADSTFSMADQLRPLLPGVAILCGFVEEPPHLTDVAAELGGGVCLPFFALQAGHVLGDVPAALNDAGFRGALLPPIGAHPGVPALIAASLARHDAG